MNKSSDGRGKNVSVRRAIAVLALAALAAYACMPPPSPSKGVYQPKNPEEGYVAQTVDAMVEALVVRDAARFMSKVSTGYYKGYAQLEARLKNDPPLITRSQPHWGPCGSSKGMGWFPKG